MTDPVELRRGDISDLPALEPLWVSVHHHHAASMPELAPYVDDATTWVERSGVYRELLAKAGTILVLAEERGTAIGYGLAHVMPASGSWAADTWATGPRIGEIESLAVLPQRRGSGIGTRLLDALETALAAAGVEDLLLGALPGNAAAIRLYERHGFQPTWLYLSRFAGRRAGESR